MFRRFLRLNIAETWSSLVLRFSQAPRRTLASHPSFEMLEDRTVPSGFQFLPQQQSLFNLADLALTPPQAGAPLDVARTYLRVHAASLGITPFEATQLALIEQDGDPDTNLSFLHFGQVVNGLPVNNVEIEVDVGADGSVLSVTGNPLSALSRNVPLVPPTSAVQATIVAAQTFGLVVPAIPTVLTPPTDTTQAQVLSSAGLSLANIPAHLAYEPVPGGVRQVWEVEIQTIDHLHAYDIRVDTLTAKVLAFSDNEFQLNGNNAGAGGAGGQVADPPNAAPAQVGNTAYRVFAFPIRDPLQAGAAQSLQTNPWFLDASPLGWQNINANTSFLFTRGNNANAQVPGPAPEEDEAQASVNGPTGTRVNGTLTFNFPADLNNALPNTYTSAAAVNAFYWNNLLHDLFYRYGFNEAAGNFQQNNFGKGGVGNDAVQIFVQDPAQSGPRSNAVMTTPPDGESPSMQLGVFTTPNPQRDSDFANQIIIHEYGHAVSRRLTQRTGENDPISGTQGEAMSEGWSDYYGLMFLQPSPQTPGAGQNDPFPFAPYFSFATPEDDLRGVRQNPYSFNMQIDPLTFAGYNAETATDPHANGTIWGSALWDMNWLLINKYGYSDISAGSAGAGGNNRALRLVLEAERLHGANPSFITARNAILTADKALYGGADLREIWSAFARRGLGFSASTAGPDARTLTSATDLPPWLVNGNNPPSPQQSSAAQLAVDLGFSTAQLPPDQPLASNPVFLKGEVDQLYELYLRRAADPLGEASGTAFLLKGGTLEQLTAALVSSQEYFNFQGGTITGYVTGLYRDLLQRDPDPAGLAGFSQMLSSGARNRLQVARDFISSTEYQQLLASDLFQRFLHRAPDAAALAAMTTLLQNGGSSTVLIDLLVHSPEYQSNAAM